MIHHHDRTLKRFAAALVCAACALSYAAPASGQSAQSAHDNRASASERPEQPLQELFRTELPIPQERREFQLTLSPRALSWSNAWLRGSALAGEFGITDRWQIAAEFSTMDYRDEGEPRTTRLNSAAVGLQRSFVQLLHGSFDAAIGGSVEVPFGQAGTDDSPTSELSLSVMHEIHRAHQTHVVASVSVESPWRHEEDEKRFEVTAGVGAFVPVGFARFTAEVTRAVDSRPESEATRTFVTPGVMFALPSGIEVGAAVSYSSTRDSRLRDFLMKFSYEFR